MLFVFYQYPYKTVFILQVITDIHGLKKTGPVIISIWEMILTTFGILTKKYC